MFEKFVPERTSEDEIGLRTQEQLKKLKSMRMVMHKRKVEVYEKVKLEFRLEGMAG